MDLTEFLRNYPQVKVATHADDERLKAFFNRTPMKGKGLQLLYVREPTFFGLLSAHSKDALVLYVENENHEIEGAGTFVFRPAMVHGKREMVAYLGDLRVDNIRRWGRFWREFYLSLMRAAPSIREFQESRYFLTALMKQNQRAQKALGESAVGYHRYQSYKMVNVLRAWRPVSHHFQVKRWDQFEEPVLWDFHRQANLSKPFGWVFDETHHEGKWRLERWKNFSMTDGYALCDERGIALSGAFWSPRDFKKIILKELPPLQKTLLGWLSPILRLPAEGEELKCLYLTMLDKRPGLSDSAYQRGVQQLIKIGLRLARERGFHFVSLPEFESLPLSHALSPYLTVKTDLELYLVDPSKNPTLDFSKDCPGFEMGLV